MEKPIFIVGLPRSGSTLWLNIVAKNPDIFRIGEILFLTPWRKDFRYFIRKQFGNALSENNVHKMVELIFSEKSISGITASFWYHDLKKVNDPLFRNMLEQRIQESDKSLGGIFKSIVEEMASYNGYKRYCAKFPVYVNFVPKLLEWYPQCKIVHITRDPRAMAISRSNDPEGTQLKIKKHPLLSQIIRKTMVQFVMLQYIWTSRLHIKYKAIDNYALFRYEDLLERPETVVKELCDFTEIPFVPEMLYPDAGQASSVTGKKQGGFNINAATHWKKVISPLQKRTITIITKNSMRRFAYDYKNHPVFRYD